MAERPVEQLDDGTPIYGPIGEMLQDGDRVRCHLCGRWLRMVAGSHLLSRHEMTTSEYRELFQLDVTLSTACAETSERKRATMLKQIADGGPGRVYPLERGGPVPTIPRWRSLAVRRPDLLAEWDRDVKTNPDPYSIGEYSQTKVAWRCRTCGHRWWQTPKVRRRGRGCPACGRRRIIQATIQRNQQPPARDRSLAVLRPDLLLEWHPDRNEGIDPFAISRGSERKVWWRCATCQTEWQTAVNDRTRTTPHGCPTCSLAKRAAGLSVMPRERSLAVRYPHLFEEWHPTRNGDLDPYTIAPSSERKVWWRCRYCSHEWQTSPQARRHSPGGCPTCAQSRGQQARPRRRQVAPPAQATRPRTGHRPAPSGDTMSLG
jgi:ssDNA-binding Zn-finger/Zn-ribbon topoisomerase 1